MASEDPPQFKPGIYKMSLTGGQPVHVAASSVMSYPRGIFPTNGGPTYIASPLTASIYAMDAAGTVSLDGNGQPFSGDPLSACAFGEGKIMGITGLHVLIGSTPIETIYTWSSADRASVYRATYVLDPAQGAYVFTPKVIAGPDCDKLGGAESLIEDPVDSSVLVAARKANKITRMSFTGELQVLADGKNLYDPSALAFATVGGKRYVYIVNSANVSYATGGIPSLARLAVPGPN
jgi:hypothetical protein